MRLELKAKRNRKYPPVSVGDTVRIYKKKDKLDKERVPVWSRELYKVDNVYEEERQKLYKLKNIDRPFVRSEILLVDTG